ncbi:FAD-dependent oxidoreductase [Streptomyces sp. T21Q-yed]|uniref:NAD(P)/FAD-dependent oxidoreductase n=1 Tax=Streptomyces sp. T21Q-yed TaxID=3018441 RepID=UPI0023E01F26|nr:FAD-dependent oxidoreductase [Streptomyces sp. T21Q-yed]MDF3141882.1 FAD-dependent oxidoreductase [Streptomyces sp. T21Q-yed]
MTERVVIVGGGIAGVSTATSLRAGGFDGDVTLVDSGDFPYDRPPLSKDFLTGTKDVKEIALQPSRWYDDQRVRLINRTTVTALRPGDGAVELGDGHLLRADRVVLATGGAAARLPFPGIGGERVHVLRTADDADRLRPALAPGARVLVVHVLRTADDADRLRPALAPGARVLVVGAGLIGAEVASTAVRLGCEVVLVDPVAVPLAAALGPELAAWLHALHTRHRVTAVQAAVESFVDRPEGIEVGLGGVTRLYDAVVLGVGMVPCTELARAAGLEVDRGIIVDERHVTSNPAVLAVGDPARMRGVPRTEHWEAAQHDGARAAATLLGAPEPAPAAPWFWTDRHGLHIEAVGHMEAAAQTVLRGSYDDSSFAVFGLRDGLVVAAASVDDPAAVRAARRLIDRRVRVAAGRLADPAVNLRGLLRG